MTLHHKITRPGLTMMEVMVASAILLLGITVLYKLTSAARQNATIVQRQTKATQLCQAKLAEFVSGVTALGGGDQSGTFDSDGEEPGWQWSATCSQGDIPNLWTVSIQVSKEEADGTNTEVVFSQMVLDPSQRGSTFDTVTVNGSSSSTSGSSSSGTSTGGM